jgi:FMN phosphatase YigB (HAD superfamily)
MIGFDFDGTLSNDAFFLLAKDYVKHSKACIITSRNEIGEDIFQRAAALGIPDDLIFAIGKIHKLYPNKADFIKHKQMMSDNAFHISMFFDNDPYEVEALQKAGILGMWIMPDVNDHDGYQPGGLMAEIVDTFVQQRNKPQRLASTE